MTTPIAYVLLSGGIDSATCVSEAVHAVGQKNVRCVSIDYGQRHIRELESAKAVANYYGRPHETIKIHIPNSLLTNPDLPVPDISYAEIRGVSPSYVPFRNGLMLSTLASHIAGLHFDPTKEFLDELDEETRMTLNKTRKDNPDYMRDCLLYFGAHAEDAAGWAYPDCTPEFIGAMANALYVGTYHKLRLLTPWAFMMKDQIIKRGTELGTPYHLTWSCLARDTEILTLRGKEPIQEIQPGRWVWGFDDIERRWVPSLVEASWFQGIREVFEVCISDGAGHYTSFKVTGDHLLMLREGGYARVDELERGVRLMPARPYIVKVGKNKVPYYVIRPYNVWDEERVYMHRYVASFFGISEEGVVHHGPEGSLNNDPSNLSSMSWGDHTRHHMNESADSIWNDNVNQRRAEAVARSWENYSPEEREARREAISRGRRDQNHIIVNITKVGEEPTYDLQTSTQNFALGAGIFVHNCYKGGSTHCGTCATCQARKGAFVLAGVEDPTKYLTR